MFYIYILKSLKDQRTYIGYTSNLVKRLTKHKTGQAKATKYRLPMKLIFTEAFQTAREAKKRERWWKSGAGRRKLKEIFDR
ncbi:MAG: GIY-YIG nuclease family protein [Candidatus Portnoybacteria bacterium]|nr:GIY-YIG nuclease family protein [Candidatus Portnoybacteria bacterium]